tara:strand:- start:365 stop:592 length:228 start_codon:yes stop_codon:yes gene_type:complete
METLVVVEEPVDLDYLILLVVFLPQLCHQKQIVQVYQLESDVMQLLLVVEHPDRELQTGVLQLFQQLHQLVVDHQ